MGLIENQLLHKTHTYTYINNHWLYLYVTWLKAAVLREFFNMLLSVARLLLNTHYTHIHLLHIALMLLRTTHSRATLAPIYGLYMCKINLHCCGTNTYYFGIIIMSTGSLQAPAARADTNRHTHTFLTKDCLCISVGLWLGTHIKI